MKRSLFSMVCVALSMGQMCVSQATGPPSNPLYPEVSDRMRFACANWIPNDDGIAVVYHAFEADRQAGFTEQQAYLSCYAVVDADPQGKFKDNQQATSAYITCMGAIIQEVWP